MYVKLTHPSSPRGEKVASQISHWPPDRLFKPRASSLKFISRRLAVIRPNGVPYLLWVNCGENYNFYDHEKKKRGGMGKKKKKKGN